MLYIVKISLNFNLKLFFSYYILRHCIDDLSWQMASKIYNMIVKNDKSLKKVLENARSQVIGKYQANKNVKYHMRNQKRLVIYFLQNIIAYRFGKTQMILFY